MKQENILIIDNIRSAENVGAIFRTADAVGINKIYLVGLTPAPLDRFRRKRSDIAKSALGAEEFVAWEQKKLICPLITKLKRDGFQIIAIEQDSKSIDYKKVKLKSKNAFILGREVEGISKKTLDMCDVVAEIKMLGEKESLNVSVATGVALFRILNI
ncbi:MAG: TrmH family RNA methyltransferase [Candidatus Pacebacteria bacterium]|nr:TrmH family RNA methyltransferase [Candidatus Paceibacterota bacterium]MBP9839397.1 TrmH family RNA methyltransferase [Candidatus Paceibacterota bacterium]